MLYPICPTCGFLLCDKQIIFEEKKSKINNDKNIVDKKKEIEKLLIQLGLKRYCCKMRMISYVNLVDIII